MKKLKYNILLGALILLTTSISTSCTDGNDWEVNAEYSRLFSVPKMSISTTATEAEITFTGTPDTEYYIIELSKDSLYDNMEAESAVNSITYGEDKTIIKSPFTITDLDNSTKYFIRIKSMASEKESIWAYPEGYYFKTKSEQIMKDVSLSNITSNAATLYWTAGSKVTHMDLLKGKEFIRKIDLSSEEIAAGSIRIEGLEELSQYSVNLYNGEVKRGYAYFRTYRNIPQGDKVINLTANDSLNNTLFKTMAEAGYRDITITLPKNSSFYNTGKISIPENMSVTFFGLPGDIKPIIGVQQFELGSAHDFITFYNVEISAYSVNESGSRTQNNYIFNQSGATTVNKIEFTDCFIRDFKNTPMRLQDGSKVKTINTLLFNDCIIYGPESRSYSIVHIDAGSGVGKIENIYFLNSTVWRSGKSLIYSNKTDLTSITIKNCTFSKVPGEGDYIIDCSSNNGPSQGVIFENNILGSIGGNAAKGIRCTGIVNVMNSYNTKDWSTTGNSIKDLIEYEGKEESLFVNPVEGDFAIKDNSFPGKKSVGDPRWYMLD